MNEAKHLEPNGIDGQIGKHMNHVTVVNMAIFLIEEVEEKAADEKAQ